jgi:branched-chain amino acid aminotransferase
MAQQYPEWIWQNGDIKPWKDATARVAFARFSV